MKSFKNIIPGILVCLAVAAPAWAFARLVPVIGGPVAAIVEGMVIALFWSPGDKCRPGVSFVSKKILQTAVVFLGFGLNRNVILSTGRQSLPVILCTISVSLVIAFVMHKWVKKDSIQVF